jgi:ferritin-like metal-binding protein YciE
MKSARMPLMQQPRQILALRFAPLHRGLEQRFLNVSGYVAPHVQCGTSEQARKMIHSITHSALPICTWEWNSGGRTAFHCHHCERKASFMGFFTKDIKSMEDLLLHVLQDIYYAEQQILKALPKMIDKATNKDLVAGLKAHLDETNKQVERLDKVFAKLGKEPSGTNCPAIDGLIKEADETAGEIEDKAVLDAAIVANAQAVEHYEMCRYGTLIAWAEELGHDDIVRFLTTNLNEEKAANTKLNTVALRKGVNAKASNAA